LGDRARGALERRRALYGVIKLLRARLYLGILNRSIRICSSRGSPRLFGKIGRKQVQTQTPTQLQFSQRSHHAKP
jgi:hypothetical protein